MDREYQQDYDEYIPMDEISDDEIKSLPPRSAKHGFKPKKKNGNILQMLTGSLIFIIIIAISVYFFMNLSDNNTTESFDIIPNHNTTTGESNIYDQQLNYSDSEVVESEANETAGQNDGQNTEETNTTVELNREETIHIVKSGENLFRISILYYNSGEYYEQIANYNGLNSASDIYVGMNLKIPSKEELMTNQ